MNLYSNILSNTWVIVFGIILAIAAVVFAFIFIVPEKKSCKKNKFWSFLHNTVNFKYLVIEKILQALYIFMTAFCLVAGFCLLFVFKQNYWGEITWDGGYGILLMLFGPIAVRLVFEASMMFVLIVKNIISINSKLKNQNEGENTVDLFASPLASKEKEDEAAPAGKPSFCPNCGHQVEAGNYCTYCGTKC